MAHLTEGDANHYSALHVLDRDVNMTKTNTKICTVLLKILTVRCNQCIIVDFSNIMLCKQIMNSNLKSPPLFFQILKRLNAAISGCHCKIIQQSVCIIGYGLKLIKASMDVFISLVKNYHVQSEDTFPEIKKDSLSLLFWQPCWI